MTREPANVPLYYGCSVEQWWEWAAASTAAPDEQEQTVEFPPDGPDMWADLCDEGVDLEGIRLFRSCEGVQACMPPEFCSVMIEIVVPADLLTTCRLPGEPESFDIATAIVNGSPRRFIGERPPHQHTPSKDSVRAEIEILRSSLEFRRKGGTP